jgi:P27 family predicted phage terminase small subunit
LSKKKPNSFHRLAGSFRADRHAKSGLNFPPATGTAPRWLSKAAKAEWRRVAPLLLEQSALLETDLAILGAYCSNFAGFLECKALVEQQGPVLTVEAQTRTGKSSKPIRNPAVQLMFDYQRAMLTAAAKLGFSPLDRERIEGSEQPDDGYQPLQPTFPPAKANKITKTTDGVHGDALGAFIEFPEEATNQRSNG